METFTNYFKFNEFIDSQIALDNNITNIPNHPSVLSNISRLWHFLNYVRGELEHPIFINSAYRCEELNSIIPGSSSNSLHKKGLAADICTYPSSMDKLYNILSCFPLREFIKYDTFIHIAI